MMHGPEKSDPLVVATNPANNFELSNTEPEEPRRGAKGNASQQSTRRTQSRESVSLALERVRKAAKANPKLQFTSLLHHIDVDLLKRSYFWLKRNAAPGIDGVTWEEYALQLDDNIAELHARIHRGVFRAQPSRRRNIPKPDGRMRPLGIASLEDKIAQRAVVEVLNEIYEVDFLGFSYGFRPGRSQHDALDALAVGICRKRVNWVVDADIQSFFDTVNHEWLMRFLEHRIADQRILRLIRKWLKAGVMDEGVVLPTTAGTPQGAVISPLLANIYLHYVFDLWAQRWRRRTARGHVIIVRFADDIVVGFEHEAEARQFTTDMKERFATYALTLHPLKTRLLEFGRYASENRKRRGDGKPETFAFLGFVHLCGCDRRGRFQLWRKTRGDRMRRTLLAIKEHLRRHRHEPVHTQGAWLKRVVSGYFQYHAVPTNSRALHVFRVRVKRLWWRTLRSRSQKDRTRAEWMTRLAERWLPPAHIIHPWPDVRFAVKHPRWEPSAGIPLARICAGGV